jgi:serine protease
MKYPPLNNRLTLWSVSVRKIFLILLLLVSASSFAVELQRTVPEKSQVMSMQTMAPTGRIVIKYNDESGIVVGERGISTNFGKANRHFTASIEQIDADRIRGEQLVGHMLPNLNRYGVINPGIAKRDELLQVLSQILTNPDVETAYLEPKAVPAGLGFDAFTGTFSAPEIITSKTSRFSPDYQSQQGYLGASPVGVNALAVNSIPGARGSDMKMLDVEGAWLWDHEDLPIPFYTNGGQYNDQSWRDHGTAVLGEIRGSDNGLGVRGITPDCQVGGVSIASQSTASALTAAWQNLDVGDVILIELHAPGPNSNGTGQFGYVPMEYWQENFDAIQIGTANGRIFCEAAGNGEQDLDSAVYGTTFDRNVRDSGAIMCGAATSGAWPEWFTNYGSRVDVNGWGSQIVTCGYGNLQGGAEEVWYTNSFGGTSGASPIIVGSVMSLQGIVKSYSGSPLDAFTIRDALALTGSPQNGTNNVGPRPDILAAWNHVQTGIGTVEGTVSDLNGPIEGIAVSIQNATTVTDNSGFYSITTTAGTHSIEFRSFFHTPFDTIAELVSGSTVIIDATLDIIPVTNISGMIRTEDGTVASNARCSIPGTSIFADTSAGDGSFLFTNIPIGDSYNLLFDGQPGYGVDFLTIDTNEQTTIYTELAVADHNFDLWWELFESPDGNWTWGVPQAGPSSGFSGDKCWGVGTDGTGYENDIYAVVNAQTYTFLYYDQLLLSFHYWCDTEEGQDGVQLQIEQQNLWVPIEPLNGYTGNVSAHGDEPAWSGNSNGWQGVIFDIEQYANLPLKLRLVFKSNSETPGIGFFFDDFTFDTGNVVTAVESTPGKIIPQVEVYPNPFNPQTSINWAISEPGLLKVELFDVMGRKTRTLHNGLVTETSGNIIFNGKTDAGNNLASGTYLLQVTDGKGQIANQRVSLVR